MHLQYLILYIESILLGVNFIGMFFTVFHIEFNNNIFNTLAGMTVVFQLLIEPILGFLCIYSLSIVLKYKYYLKREMESEELKAVKHHMIYMYFFVLYFLCWAGILYFKILPQPPSSH